MTHILYCPVLVTPFFDSIFQMTSSPVRISPGPDTDDVPPLPPPNPDVAEIVDRSPSPAEQPKKPRFFSRNIRYLRTGPSTALQLVIYVRKEHLDWFNHEILQVQVLLLFHFPCGYLLTGGNLTIANARGAGTADTLEDDCRCR